MPSCGFLLFFVKHHAEDLMSLCSKFKILTKENILFLEKLLSRNAILQCAMYIICASLFCLHYLLVYFKASWMISLQIMPFCFKVIKTRY